MSEYGQVINPGYDPAKNHVFEAFCNYFNNPTLTKIKDVEQYSVYMVKIHSMLGNASRYLIIFIAKDLNDVKTEKQMNTCEWISLQTRTLTDRHKIKVHSYPVKSSPPLNQKISIHTRENNTSIYDCEKFPLEVTLLHTRKNHSYQYNPSGTIISALETYQTIVNFKRI
jgi:hypothetical protein